MGREARVSVLVKMEPPPPHANPPGIRPPSLYGGSVTPSFCPLDVVLPPFGFPPQESFSDLLDLRPYGFARSVFPLVLPRFGAISPTPDSDLKPAFFPSSARSCLCPFLRAHPFLFRIQVNRNILDTFLGALHFSRCFPTKFLPQCPSHTLIPLFAFEQPETRLPTSSASKP